VIQDDHEKCTKYCGRKRPVIRPECTILFSLPFKQLRTNLSEAHTFDKSQDILQHGLVCHLNTVKN